MSHLGAWEDARGSWLRFDIFIMFWIWSLVFGTPMIQIWALYLDFDGVKNIHVLYVLMLGFGGCWRFLTGVWHLHHDLDMMTLYTDVPNFGSLSWFWRCKEHPCPLSPHLGLQRMPLAHDWGLASWSWFGYGHWSLIPLWFEVWLDILILKVQRIFMSF